MIVVWGRVEAMPEYLDEAKRISLEHVHRSRAEPGCLRHGVHSDVENPNVLVFYEEWRDMAALQAHFQVPASGQFVAALQGLVIGEPEIKIYEADLAR